MLLEPGKYVAKVGELNNQKIVVYETEHGALCAAIPCEVAEGDKAGTVIKHTVTLITRDGTIQTRTLDTLKEIFGFPGADPFWLMDTDLSEVRFEIVVEAEQGEKGGEFSKVKWINPLGGGQKMPEAADRRAVLAKFGSKFRALSGGAPAPAASARPAAPGKPAPKTAPPKKSPPPAPAGPTATMEEAWEELCKANPNMNESQATEIWYSKMRELFNTDDNSQITPQQWHQLKEALTDNVPMN